MWPVKVLMNWPCTGYAQLILQVMYVWSSDHCGRPHRDLHCHTEPCALLHRCRAPEFFEVLQTPMAWTDYYASMRGVALTLQDLGRTHLEYGAHCHPKPTVITRPIRNFESNHQDNAKTAAKRTRQHKSMWMSEIEGAVDYMDAVKATIHKERQVFKGGFNSTSDHCWYLSLTSCLSSLSHDFPAHVC